MNEITLYRTLAVALIIAAAYFINLGITKRFSKQEGGNFRSQLATMIIVILSIIMIVVVFPINDTVRGQLLGLIGILISAMIALSSATFMSNVMAGVMLRTLNVIRPGSFLTIGEYFGRVTEMDLLHCEIQTEERDLITLPNLYMVTHPNRVFRSSGTVVSVTLSLGYDVSRQVIEKHLLTAAGQADLESPFVQITELGDFSVSYRISGMLTDLSKLLSTRRLLRAAVLDELHNNGIEIVSPTFINQRQFDKTARFIPAKVTNERAKPKDIAPDDVVFDKAAKAETLEALRDRMEQNKQKIEEVQAQLKDATEDVDKQDLATRIANLEKQRDIWEKVIQDREEILKSEN